MNYICHERNVLPTRKNTITLHSFREGAFNRWLNVFFSMIKVHMNLWLSNPTLTDANLFMARPAPATYKFVHLLLSYLKIFCFLSISSPWHSRQLILLPATSFVIYLNRQKNPAELHQIMHATSGLIFFSPRAWLLIV